MTICELSLDSIQKTLSDLPLGGILFSPQLSSTNDFALDWATQNTQDLWLVITNYQTAGRGRKNHQWISSKDSSLTFSLILTPSMEVGHNYSFYTALGALAVINAIKQINGEIDPKIKWPNDILIEGEKVCGILVEASWIGNKIERVIIGIGINISIEAVPQSDLLTFSATSLEDIIGKQVDRLDLLRRILDEIVKLRKTIETSRLIQAWEENLAFRGTHVEVWEDGCQTREGILAGLTQDGALRLIGPGDTENIIHFGEMHLCPSVSHSNYGKMNI